MLIRRVVQHHLDNDADVSLVRGFEKDLEVIQRAIVRMNRPIVRDVIAVVAQRRRKERHQPNRIDAKLLQIIKLLRQAAEISVAITAAVVKSTDMRLVNDRVFVPKRILRCQLLFPEDD